MKLARFSTFSIIGSVILVTLGAAAAARGQSAGDASRGPNPLRTREPVALPTIPSTDLPAQLAPNPTPPSVPAAPAALNAPAAPVQPPQDASPRPAGTSPSDGDLTDASIQALTKQVRESPTLDETARAELLKRYQTAAEHLKTAAEAARRASEYEQEIQNGAAEIQRVRGLLAMPPAEFDRPSARGKTIAELETALGEAETRLSASRTAVAEREAELKNRAERHAELTKKSEEVSVRLAEAEKDLTLPAPPDESAETTTARRTELQAKQQSLRATARLYQAEIKRIDKLADLFPLRRDLAKRGANLHEKEVKAYQALVAEARKFESERQAREAQRQAQMAAPALRGIAEHNAALAEERKQTSDRVTNVSEESKEVGEELLTLDNELRGVKNKVEKAGHSATVGLLLRRKSDVLPSIAEGERRLRFVEGEMPKVNLRRIELEEERTSLGDIDAAQEVVMRELYKQFTGDQVEQLEQTVQSLLISKRDLLDKLIGDLDAYLFALGELETQQRQLVERSEEFREFINEHVLWIRSDDAMTLATVPLVARGAFEIAQPQGWLRLTMNSGLETLREPWTAGGVLLAVGLLLAFQAQLRRRVKNLCETRANSQGWKFLPAVRALLLSAAVSAPWPLLIGFFGWHVQSSALASPLGLAVGPALIYSAGLLWLSRFMRTLCRAGGVAETFFNWPSSSLKVVVGAIRWLTWLGIPSAFVVVLAQLYNQGEWAGSVGRVSFIVAMLLLIATTRMLFGSKNHVFRQQTAKDSGEWLGRLRIAAYITGVVVPAALTILSLIGYYYSAQQLAIRFQKTLFMGLACVLIHAIVTRWFVVKRRQIAMEQSRERQAAQTGTDSDTKPVPTPDLADSPDWAAVHEQLKLLLRQALTVGMLLGCWLIWSDVFPALKILDNVELWSKTAEVTERIEGPDGDFQYDTRTVLTQTTLRHALIASIVLFAAFVLGRNLPALLQITVLNRLPLDRGGRHAVSIMLHYGLALTGGFVALRTLHINWSSVQWLAAGITVGLGFGLQEIFANFFSGLILLFERPIRVGDIITLGDVTGTVTNIRIRATTVTNWDRKELIVPNKDLVTGRLLNWTLSDTTNRIVINVGIAYASNTVQARLSMQEVVLAHPNVLQDPGPVVTFEAFGDSTLNFVIRAYLASLDVRLETIHQLHEQLHQRLGEDGIEIAFPQRDLNIRSVDVAAQAFFGKASKSIGRGEATRSDAA